jgi:hypothetical protein
VEDGGVAAAGGAAAAEVVTGAVAVAKVGAGDALVAAAIAAAGAATDVAGSAGVESADVEPAAAVRCDSSDAAVARENPAGVSGASAGDPGDEATPGKPALEVAPVDVALAEVALVDIASVATCLAATVEVEDVAEPLVAARSVPATVAVLSSPDPFRRDGCPFFLDAPRAAEAPEVPLLEPSARAVNKPSKNANRGCVGEISRSLSTSARAALKSSALNACSVCVTRSVTSCGYCGA